MEHWLERLHALLSDKLASLALNILLAIVVFVIGRWVARALVRGANRLLEQRDIDVSLRKFLVDVAYVVLLVAVATAALSTAGVQTTAVVAVLGASSLAIGLALQGSLSNFAAGVLLIILRPYKVGDTVLIGKHNGRVEAIKVFQTILSTSDNREITIPNGQIVTAPIENYTARGTRRVDIALLVKPEANLYDVRTEVTQRLSSAATVLAKPGITVDLAELTPTSVKLVARAWVQSPDYATSSTELLETVRASDVLAKDLLAIMAVPPQV